MDNLSADERSALMARIRSVSTAPEMTVQRIARTIKSRFQVNSKRLPGTPDLAFFRVKRAIFVHGCFWHQHQNRHCKRSNRPKSNRLYWVPKLSGNIKRDRAARRRLRALGWRVLVIWECQCKNKDYLRGKMLKFLTE
jgi:DNA mismatch endonuclease (patch repair protein)